MTFTHFVRGAAMAIRFGAPLLLATTLAAAAIFSSTSHAQTVFSTYSLIPSGVGSTVSVHGYYSGPDEPMLLDDLGTFLRNQPMPARTYLLLDGAIPPDLYTAEEITVTGVLDTVRRVPAFQGFTTIAVIHVQTFSSPRPPGSGGGSGSGVRKSRLSVGSISAVECDSCKFALIFSGGINADNNHRRYWNDVAKKFDYKRGAGYCDTNIAVLYYDGTPKDAAQVPAARVKQASVANFNAAMDSIKARVARCKARGKKTEFQFLVTNHGDSASLGGIHLFGPGVLTPSAVKAKFKGLIDAGVDDIYAEFAECFGGGQVDTLKTLADSTSKTSIHLASAASRFQPSRSRRDLQTDLFEDEFINARVLGLTWSQAFVRADSADSADYRANRPFWDRYRVGPETPQYFEILSHQFTKGGEAMEFKFSSACSTICVHFPGSDGATRCGNVTIECQVVNGTDTTWQVIKIWNWNVGQKKYFRACNVPGATGTYRIVSHSNGYPTLVKVQCLRNTSVPETPTDAPIYNAFAIGAWDGRNAEFNPHLGEGGGGPYFTFWSTGSFTSSIPAFLGTNYFPGMSINIPFAPDPSRTWLYVGGNLTASYVNPGVLTIFPADIFDPSGLQVSSLSALVHLSQPGHPSGDQFFTVQFTRSGGVVQPVNITLPLLYAEPLNLELQVTQPGYVSLDAILLDPFGSAPVTAVPGSDPAGSGRRPLLLQNAPNPFTHGTAIAFTLPTRTNVRITIYDVAGRMLKVLADERMEAGIHSLQWDGRDAAGRLAPDGVYFYRLDADGSRQSRKLLFVK